MAKEYLKIHSYFLNTFYSFRVIFIHFRVTFTVFALLSDQTSSSKIECVDHDQEQKGMHRGRVGELFCLQESVILCGTAQHVLDGLYCQMLCCTKACSIQDPSMLCILSVGPGADDAVRDGEFAMQNENLTLTDHKQIVEHNKSVS